MAINDKDIKILWANSAGICSYPDCHIKLSLGVEADVDPHTVGEMAHIKGKKEGANRYDPSQDDDERDLYQNLILLCAHHHTIIDKKENEAKYSIDVLHAMKRKHEEFISSRTQPEQRMDTREELAQNILPYMDENFQVFINYGPKSEVARKRPESDAHNTWLYARAATIVPNNKYISSLVRSNLHLFSTEEQKIIAEYRTHVSGYEQWVNDKASYEGVVRYPRAFDDLIRGLINASTE